MSWLICISIFISLFVGRIFSLRLEDAREGSCTGLHHIRSTAKVDAHFLDNLLYIVGGNRYHIYRAASNHLQFSKLREYELYYGACFTRNSSYSATHPSNSVSGFGGIPLGKWRVVVKRNHDGSIDAIEHWTGPRKVLEQRVVLSDHKTFAVLAGCWTDTNQKMWNMLSLSAQDIPLQTERLVEEHMASLGFDREEVVFLNRKSCNDRRPLGSQQPSRHVRPRPVKQIARDSSVIPAGINSEDLLRHLNTLNRGNIPQLGAGWSNRS